MQKSEVLQIQFITKYNLFDKPALSHSDQMNLAVGFNPRKGLASERVATRIHLYVFRGLKTTAKFS
jgi:hypothetical protein